jgi:hypothetical protein
VTVVFGSGDFKERGAVVAPSICVDSGGFSARCSSTAILNELVNEAGRLGLGGARSDGDLDLADSLAFSTFAKGWM